MMSQGRAPTMSSQTRLNRRPVRIDTRVSCQPPVHGQWQCRHTTFVVHELGARSTAAWRWCRTWSPLSVPCYHLTASSSRCHSCRLVLVLTQLDYCNADLPHNRLDIVHSNLWSILFSLGLLLWPCHAAFETSQVVWRHCVHLLYICMSFVYLRHDGAVPISLGLRARHFVRQ